MNSEVKNIKATDYSPEVVFDTTGLVKISGELRTGDPIAFFSRMDESIISNLGFKKSFEIYFRLTYVSSSNLLGLLNLIKKIPRGNRKLIWEYDSHDDDIKELGSIIKESCAPDLILKKEN